MINPRRSLFLQRLSFLFLLLSCLFPPILQADVEPDMENLVTNYFITDIEGAGDVRILKDGLTQWQRALVGARLEEGDQISVGDDTEVILSLQSKTLIHLDEGTQMSVAQLEENQSGGFLTRLKLLTGAVLSDVKKHLSESNSQFEVESGGVVCGVRGTVFEVANNNGEVQTSTDEGVVEVRTPKGSRQVAAGQTCSASRSGIASLHPCNAQTRSRFQTWHQIHQQLQQKHGLEEKQGHFFSHPIGPHSIGTRLGHNPAGGRGHGSISHGSALPPAHGAVGGHR